MSSNVGKWCLIESDPGVFTELIKGFGVKGVQVEELWSLDNENFDRFKPIYGLIFLFKWKPDFHDNSNYKQISEYVDKIYFAKQVVDNACATQALINILLNLNNENIDFGETLTEFKNFTMNFMPSIKGLTLTNCEKIRMVHNSFARQELIESDDKIHDDKEDVFHFTCYIPFENHLYELDGLKNCPIDLGSIPPNTNWIDMVRPIIEAHMKKYSEGEIHFNLMAVVPDLRDKYRRDLEKLQRDDMGMETDDIQSEINRLHLLIEEEEEKMKKYKIENIRRKHNYIPFIIEYLKILGEEGILKSYIEKEEQNEATANQAKLQSKSAAKEVSSQ